MAAALDQGVTWFDVAPPYGDGQAEDLLGTFLAGRRQEVVVCTKFGLARPQIGAGKRLLRPLARQVVSMVPSLRKRASQSRVVAVHAPIRPETIAPSVADSLKRLRTDYIDVLAIHEPSLEDAARAEIHDVLAQLVAKGMVRAVSVAGSHDAARAALHAGRPVAFAQFPDTPFANFASKLRQEWPSSRPMFVTHSVFGSGALERMRALPQSTRNAIFALGAADGAGPLSPAQALLRFAFGNNPDGVVIASMYSADHIERNCTLAAEPADTNFASRVGDILASADLGI